MGTPALERDRRWTRGDPTGRTGGGWRLLGLLDAACLAAIVYVCALAIDPALADRAPAALRWFGAPGNHVTIAVILALPLVHLGLRRIVGKTPLRGPPLVVIAAMAASALVLGMSAYWRCHGDQAPFFAPLSWTLALFLGNVEIPFGADGYGVCSTMSLPVALEIARLVAVATTLTAALAAALALFRSQLDRIEIWRARLLTVVVDIDDETVSMVRAIARTQNPAATLVVLTDDTDSGAARAARQLGARLRAVDLTEADSLSRLPLWSRLDRLYLLSADPMQNVTRFTAIDAALRRTAGRRPRVPLTVRMTTRGRPRSGGAPFWPVPNAAGSPTPWDATRSPPPKWSVTSAPGAATTASARHAPWCCAACIR
jgi:hypothetical protein